MTGKSQVALESKKVTYDIIWVGLSQIVTSLLGIIILPALTKSYTTETFGIWAQISTTVSLVVPLLTLQFETTVVRFLAGEDDKNQRRRSLGTMLTAILIFCCFIFFIISFLSHQLSLFLFDNPYRTIFVFLTFIWTTIDALYVFFIAYLRSRSKIRKLSIIQAAFSTSKMILIVGLAKSGLQLEWIVTSIVLIEVIFTLGVLYLITREDGFPIINFQGLKVFLAFSIPQIPVGVLAWIMSASDRYFITHFLNLSQTGIYSTSNALGGLISLFSYPIGYVLYPVVSRAWEKKRKTDTKVYFEYSIKLFLTAAIPAAIGLAILSQSLLKILTTSEYLAGAGLVLLIGFSQIFAGIFQINEYIIYLVKQTKWLPLIISTSAAVSIGLNAVLIPSMGITGAALSKIVAYFILAIIVTIWTKKAINININFKYLGKVVVASILMTASIYFLNSGTIGLIILSIIIGVLVFILTLFLLRAISEEEKRLIKQVLSGVHLWLHFK